MAMLNNQMVNPVPYTTILIAACSQDAKTPRRYQAEIWRRCSPPTRYASSEAASWTPTVEVPRQRFHKNTAMFVSFGDL